MNPYVLNLEAINDFKKYHGIKNDKDVADLLGITASYFCQLCKGLRPLNEFSRLRIQLMTRKPQDQLFHPQFDSDLFPDQSFTYKKSYGIFPLLPKKDDDFPSGKQLRFDQFPSAIYRPKRKNFWRHS